MVLFFSSISMAYGCSQARDKILGEAATYAAAIAMMDS